MTMTRGPRLSVRPLAGGASVLQRKCGCGHHTLGGGECSACAEKKRREQGALADANEVVDTPGHALAPDTRTQMERRFGRDFTGVRVHADARAAESARAVDAQAYTIGQHVVFGSNRYAPSTGPGQRLLAHELTHTLQQGTNPARASSIDRADGLAEAEAESVAHAVMARSIGATSSIDVRMSPSGLQRQPDEETVGEEEEDDVSDGDTPVNASADGEAADNEAIGDFEGIELADASDLIELAGGKGGQKKKKKKTPPPAPKGPAPGSTITRIDVDLAKQSLTLTWSDGTKEAPHAISSGRGRPNTTDDPCKTQTEENCTPVGDFPVGAIGDQDTKNSEGDAMSWYVGFVDDRSIGIHDSQPVPGVPHSHGCVRVGIGAANDAFAKKINKNVEKGKTIVHVFGKAPTKPWKKAAPKKKGKK